MNARWNIKTKGRNQINKILSKRCSLGVNSNISRRLK
nr:MAG TPA: hypothetical protein [Caudoviricetes sp.]